MHMRRLENLRERLLRGGIAPRHVRRYLCELREHYDDALRAELARGSSLASAEQVAWARLGTEDDLARSVLAQPELRSTAARHPRLVFGAGPVLLWTTSLVLVFCAMRLLSEALGSEASQQPAWMLPSAYAFCIFCVRALPVALGVAMLTASVRQRLSVYWPIVGVALVNLLAGTVSVNLMAPSALGQGGQLGVSSLLLPFVFPFSDLLGRKDMLALGVGLGRALCMVAITLTPYLLWRIRERMAT
jgi:hypothetical protein